MVSRVIVAVIVLAAMGKALAGDVGAKTPVEIWRVGDDALTAKFGSALEQVFSGSPDFVVSGGKAPGTLIVLIATNLVSEKFGSERRAHYVIEFMLVDGRKVGDSKGSCWETELRKCAEQVLGDATTVQKSGRS